MLPSNEQEAEETLPSFPFLLDNVFLTDIVWIPKESKVALLGPDPVMWVTKINLASMPAEKWLQEVDGVPREEFRRPLTLQDGLEISFSSNDDGNTTTMDHKCSKIFADAFDLHLEPCFHVVHCHYESAAATPPEPLQQCQQLTISYKNRTITRFNIAPSTTMQKNPFAKINADSSTQFFRPPPPPPSESSRIEDDFKASVLSASAF